MLCFVCRSRARNEWRSEFPEIAGRDRECRHHTYKHSRNIKIKGGLTPSLGSYSYHRHVSLCVHSYSGHDQVLLADTSHNASSNEELNREKLPLWRRRPIAGSHQTCTALLSHRCGGLGSIVTPLFFHPTHSPQGGFAPQSLHSYHQRLGLQF